MQCSHCGKEIDDGGRFCGYCGSAQSENQRCTACGQEFTGSRNFCPHCGSPTGQAQGRDREAVLQIPPSGPNTVAVAGPGISQEALVGVGWRFAATLVDGIIFVILGYILALFSGGTTADGFALTGAPALLWLLIGLAYYVVMEAMSGATVGKLACGLRVLKTDGSPCDWQASLVRNLLRIVDALVFYLVAAILVWTSPQRQRLGDRVGETVVVKLSRLQA